ncbi:hypothetical protein [Serratia rhizosphaerae]|uniref:Uncharacterized protein n=1 Tax=Serratia rhizosphaerae TaxID=2597702 RepID=A0ABX6GR84_9GAMM|nr:hypothetical protein [Serratia rhizosphaerae]MEB6335327.1 hypothetical protein [Serratia rhizosphaerae]QHA88800.1 hypothetical protein FO014_18465 [Serratia rhizosphaerae]
MVGYRAVYLFIFYFGIKKKKYTELIELYKANGFSFPGLYAFFSLAGFFGCFPMALYFKRLLAANSVRMDDGGNIPLAAYRFIKSQPTALTGWVHKLYYLWLSSMLFFVLAAICAALVSFSPG